MNKTEQHVLERVKERYGLDMVLDDLHKLNDEIVHATWKGQILKNEVAQKVIRIFWRSKNKYLIVIYNKDWRTIVTALPVECEEFEMLSKILKENRAWQKRKERKMRIIPPYWKRK